MLAEPGGRLFIIDGDLTALVCDAILVPVDADLQVTRAWTEVLGVPGPCRLHHRPFADGERVMRYEASQGGEAEIWLGDVGHDDPGEAWYADALVEFVERYAAARSARADDRPARIAVNVAGSGSGGSADDKGSLFRTIVPMLHAAAKATSIDVVLVCWGARPYSAARRAMDGLDRSDDDDVSAVVGDDRIVELAGLARSGQLVLFVGAGVSMGAGLSSWSGLIESLIADLEAKNPASVETRREGFDRLDVRDQASLVAKRWESPEEFREALLRHIAHTSRYSLAHGLLSSLGTTENITTNYDVLLERAMSTADRSCAVMPYEPVTGQDRWLLKLHGSVDHPEDIVLTRSEYLGLPERSGALFGVLQAMLMTRHILFVGYSLSDDSFHRVIHEIRRAQRGHRRKVGTALLLHREPLLEELFDDVLDFIAIADHAPDSEADGADGAIGSTATGGDDLAAVARRHDIVLDRLCQQSANVSSFLLDTTFSSMLTDEERSLSELLTEALDESRSGSGPISTFITDLLGDLGAS